jgi:hypothetical protein
MIVIRVFIVDEPEEKVSIEDMYYEILNMLITYHNYDYESDKRGKMTIGK